MTEEEKSAVLDVLGKLDAVLTPALLKRSAKHQCGLAENPGLSKEEVSVLLETEDRPSVVEGLMKLVAINPDWGLQVAEGSRLVVKKPPRQYLCHVTLGFYTLGKITAIISAGKFSIFLYQVGHFGP